MSVELLFSNEWLRRKIDEDPIIEVGAGHITENLTSDQYVDSDEAKAPNGDGPALPSDNVATLRLPLEQPSAVRIRLVRNERFAARSASMCVDMNQLRTHTLQLEDDGRGLCATVAIRTVGRYGTRLQVSWIEGASVELRAGISGHNYLLLAREGSWHDLDMGTRKIDADFVSRTFELQPFEENSG